MKAVLRLVLLLCGLALAAPLQADELRPGYLELRQQSQSDWLVVYKAPILGGLATRARPLLPPGCAMQPGAPVLTGGALVSRGTMRCTRPIAGQRIGLAGMERGFTDALVRIAPLDAPAQAFRLTPTQTQVTIPAATARGTVARTYFALGVEHILTGYDHLLFVVALVLLLGAPWVVVRAATAFTIAHSITLAGTTLGLFALAQAPVEALIALSIIFLAVEIVKKHAGAARLAQRIPWIVAFLFGLLHGFGFAGALHEIGLPDGEVPMALLTFNLGVEAGQLVIIAVTLALLSGLRRLAPALLRPATLTTTYAIGTIASLWFIQRMVG